MSSGEIKAGTFGGLCFSMLGQMQFESIIQTALLAALGATVSFLISRFLQWLAKNKR